MSLPIGIPTSLRDGMQIEAYRNLNAAKTGDAEWSIRVPYRCTETNKIKRKVVGYLWTLCIDGATFKCSAKGCERIRRTQSREVIAWVEGTLRMEDGHHLDPHDEEDFERFAQDVPVDMLPVRFNPKDRDDLHFTDHNGERIDSAALVFFGLDGLCLSFDS